MTKALRTGAFILLLISGSLGCEKRNDDTPAVRAPQPNPSPPSAGNPSASSSPPRVELVNAEISVPKGISPEKPVPFLLVLHGLGDSGTNFAERAGFAELSRARRFAYAAPDGTFDTIKRRFWNAWTACCDFDELRPDHVQALGELLEKAARHPAIDKKRRYVLGFSNGGFMAHRLACEVPGLAAIASIAGAGPSPGEQCRAPTSTAVLQVHGDLDKVITYGGGHTLSDPSLPLHPSAADTVSAWAKRNGCGAPDGTKALLDLVPELAGKETSVLRYAGCSRTVELWTVKGGEHVITTDPAALEQVIGFLERQTSP